MRQSRDRDASRWQPTWQDGFVFSTSVALLVFVSVLLIPVPASVGLGARHGLTVVLVPAALLLFWAHSQSPLRKRVIVVAATALLFALPLAGIWNSGNSEPSVIGGLLPWSDASGYYTSAQRLELGWPLTPFAAKRPAFVGMLATILTLAQGNLAVALAILLAIDTAVSYLIAREVERSHGTVAGVITLLLMFLFCRRLAGLALSEHLGFPLGALGVSLLWRAASERRRGIALAGLWLLALGLIARSGAFFVLPALIWWGTRVFGRTRRASLRFAAMAAALLIGAFGLNALLGRAIAPSGGSLGEYSFSLYGIAVGGKGWKQVFTDHPDLVGLTESEQFDRAGSLALEEIRRNPLGLARGAARAWGDFLTVRGPFHYIDTRPPGVENIGYRLVLSIAVIWAVWRSWRRRGDARDSMLLHAMLGILLSVPFATPVDSDRMRAYAATTPLVILLVAVSLARAVQARRMAPVKSEIEPDPLPAMYLLGTGLVILGFVAPILVRIRGRHPDPVPSSCAAGEQEALVEIARGSTLRIVSDSAPRSRVSVVRVSPFRDSVLHPWRETDPTSTMMALRLAAIQPPGVVLITIDHRTGEFLWLIGPPELADAPQMLTICGTPDTEPLLRDLHVLTVRTSQPATVAEVTTGRGLGTE